jgi:transcription elongation factor Elf1
MWVHRLSNVDKVNKIATCSNCGQVAIVTSKTNTACINRYKAHREKYNESRRKGEPRKTEKDVISYRKKSLYIKEQKNKPCMDCGISYPYYVMDFDHRNPSEKSGNLARMGASPFEEIIAEIAKCDLVCANCHRERTYGENSKPPTK